MKLVSRLLFLSLWFFTAVVSAQETLVQRALAWKETDYLAREELGFDLRFFAAVNPQLVQEITPRLEELVTDERLSENERYSAAWTLVQLGIRDEAMALRLLDFAAEARRDPQVWDIGRILVRPVVLGIRSTQGRREALPKVWDLTKRVEARENQDTVESASYHDEVVAILPAWGMDLAPIAGSLREGLQLTAAKPGDLKRLDWARLLFAAKGDRKVWQDEFTAFSEKVDPQVEYGLFERGRNHFSAVQEPQALLKDWQELSPGQQELRLLLITELEPIPFTLTADLIPIITDEKTDPKVLAAAIRVLSALGPQAKNCLKLVEQVEKRSEPLSEAGRRAGYFVRRFKEFSKK